MFDNFINIPGAYLITCLLFFLLPIMTWGVLIGRFSLQLNYWCVSGLCFGFGVFLILQGNSMPVWSFTVSNVLFIMGYLGRIQALRLELNPPLRLLWLCGCILFFFVIYQSIWIGLHDELLRLEFVIFYHAIFNLIIILYALLVGHKLNIYNAYFIALVHFILFIAVIMQGIMLFQNTTNPEIFNTNIISLNACMVGVLSVVISNFAYIGMSLDQLISSKIKLNLTRFEELTKSQQIIAQLDRQRSLGALSASIGHEINQPLTAIMAKTQMAKTGIERGLLDVNQLTNVLDSIILNTRRANSIIEKVRGFIRPTSIEKQYVNVTQLVQETAQFINQEAMVNNVDFIFECDQSIAQVTCDATQLSQVLINLYRNALEALNGVLDGVITVSVSHFEDWIVISVLDNGPGLSEFVLKNIMEPFFTTKTDGLGLGLSISKNIIEQHNGQFFISNAKEGGACFEIMLPAGSNDCNACELRVADSCDGG